MSQALAKVAEQVETAAPAEGAAAAAVLTVAREQGDLPLPMMMRHVAADYHKSFNQILGEFVKLGYGPGKLTIEDYFDFRLFDDAALSGADKRQFIGLDVMRGVWGHVNFDQTWVGLLNDKLASTVLLQGYGFPVIPVEAIFAASLAMPKPPCKVLTSADDLRAFMVDPHNYPLFGKPLDGLQSLGSISADRFDETTGALTLVDGTQVSLDVFIKDVTTHYGEGYIVQKRLVPHAAIREICGPRLATVRVLTINPKSGPEILRACWKIPAGANAADNFWRPGNMLGTIDIATGRIERVVRGAGLKQDVLEAHPDSGTRMVGFELPMWAEVKALALAGARVFKAMGIIGWDIAITDHGPVIVEPNERPDHGLPQIADRRGLMDDKLRNFIAERKAMSAAVERDIRRRAREEGRKKVQRVTDSMGKM